MPQVLQTSPVVPEDLLVPGLPVVPLDPPVPQVLVVPAALERRLRQLDLLVLVVPSELLPDEVRGWFDHSLYYRT